MGLATPESKDQALPSSRSLGLFTKVCCTRIAKLLRDNKTTTSIYLSLFDLRFGAEASPAILGYFTPWGPYSG